MVLCTSYFLIVVGHLLIIITCDNTQQCLNVDSPHNYLHSVQYLTSLSLQKFSTVMMVESYPLQSNNVEPHLSCVVVVVLLLLY